MATPKWIMAHPNLKEYLSIKEHVPYMYNMFVQIALLKSHKHAQGLTYT